MEVDAIELNQLRGEKVFSQRKLACEMKLAYRIVWQAENVRRVWPAMVHRLTVLEVEPRELLGKGRRDDA